MAFGKQWRACCALPDHVQDMKKPNIRNILVPIDFSNLSVLAVETAKGLARRFDATIHLAHVHEFYYPAGFIAPGAPVPISMVTFRDNSANRLSDDLHMLAKTLGLSINNCHFRSSGLPPFHEICKVAREIPADLIVMPTHAPTGLAHFFEGSTAERIVQHSPCPVVVVKQNDRDFLKVGSAVRIDKVLVPVDFSSCSLAGLNYAIQFAEKAAAKIVVFHAVHLGYAYTSDGFAMYDLSVFERAARKDADRQMREFVRCAKFGRVKFETVIKVGPPVDEICAQVENKDVDLIITSTHGRTGFKHVLIGSTAEQVVRRAHCPVLVVPSHPEVRTASLTGKPSRAGKLRPKITCRATLKRRPMKRRLVGTRYGQRINPAFPERRKTNKFRESHLVQ
jgi:nucleotide-binding universal stress UspA family protein